MVKKIGWVGSIITELPDNWICFRKIEGAYVSDDGQSIETYGSSIPMSATLSASTNETTSIRKAYVTFTQKDTGIISGITVIQDAAEEPEPPVVECNCESVNVKFVSWDTIPSEGGNDIKIGEFKVSENACLDTLTFTTDLDWVSDLATNMYSLYANVDANTSLDIRDIVIKWMINGDECGSGISCKQYGREPSCYCEDLIICGITESSLTVLENGEESNVMLASLSCDENIQIGEISLSDSSWISGLRTVSNAIMGNVSANRGAERNTILTLPYTADTQECEPKYITIRQNKYIEPEPEPTYRAFSWTVYSTISGRTAIFYSDAECTTELRRLSLFQKNSDGRYFTQLYRELLEPAVYYAKVTGNTFNEILEDSIGESTEISLPRYAGAKEIETNAYCKIKTYYTNPDTVLTINANGYADADDNITTSESVDISVTQNHSTEWLTYTTEEGSSVINYTYTDNNTDVPRATILVAKTLSGNASAVYDISQTNVNTDTGKAIVKVILSDNTYRSIFLFKNGYDPQNNSVSNYINGRYTSSSVSQTKSNFIINANVTNGVLNKTACTTSGNYDFINSNEDISVYVHDGEFFNRVGTIVFETNSTNTYNFNI